MSDDKAKKPQKLETFLDSTKTQEELETELGTGVEKIPVLPPKPEIRTIKLDLSGPKDIDAIVQEINTLPEAADATKATAKYDAYKATANKLWVIKQANEDSFLLKMRVGKKGEDGKYIWERNDDGRIKTEEKRFFYSPITRMEKENQLELLEAKESANYDLIVETERINKLVRNPNEHESQKYLEKKSWLKVSKEFSEKTHAYYYGLFKAYYNATEEDLDKLAFDDITAYVEVALYKEGVRNPQ